MRKDIIITANSKTSRVDLPTSRLGLNGENLQGNIIVKFSDEFVNGNTILEIQRDNEKYYLTMQKENESYYLPILSSLLTNPTTIIMQIRITEGTSITDIPIWKSNKFYLKVEESINAEITIPEEYPEWIDIANAKLNEIDNIDIDVNKVGNTATVSITKKDGTEKSVEIYDGPKGEDGVDGQDGRDGQDGYTPQKRIDYFTEQDIEEIEGDILNEVYTKSETDTLLDEKADIEDIPDVSSFITKDVNNLTNYTLKTNTGSLIDLEINDTTYVVTLKLKNLDGTIISADTIDLPLESVVVSGRYDNTTKKVILTLENGSEVDFSVADLVAGLQTEITSSNKLASDLVDDTNSGNKFVTTSEKQTWNNKYDKPNSGIPKTDLASTVQTSLNKADTAIQEHQDISGKEDKTNKVTSIDNTSTDTQYPSAKCVHDSQATQDDEIEALQTENERLKATLPTTTGEGQDITLDKTAEMEFVKSPLPRGNTKQNTTTGKNLLNTINANTTTINGVTSYRSNGFYYLSGTNTKTDATWVLPSVQNTNLPVFEIGQTYTMSFKGTMPNGIYAQLNGVKTSTGAQYSIGSVQRTIPSITFTIDSDYSRTAQLFIGIQGATTNADCNFAIQIEKGPTATSYEPYTGGIPSPNPDYPQEVEVVTGNVEVTISNNDNSESKTLPVSLGNIELCKIGDYQDYFYKESNKWYLHKEIDKVVLDDNKAYLFYELTGDYNQINALLGITNINTQPDLFKCSHFDYYAKATSATKTKSGARIFDINVNFAFSVPNKIANSMVDWKNWLTNNNVIIFYVLATPTDTEITDTTLISQLEEISKTLSYQGQTNITSNTIALFDVEAYQSTKLILENLDSRLTLVEG